MDKIKVVCPSCFKVNSLPKKESYAKANCGQCKTSLLENKPLELTQTNFDEYIVNSDLPVVVDFWAPWCGPCKNMAPIFTQVASTLPLKVMFAKVNTQEQQTLGSRFNIRSIPTLVMFKNGKEVERVSGALDANSLKQFALK
ncbi:MAG: thioredoxin TrxC [Arcobacteraceae bacterium]